MLIALINLVVTPEPPSDEDEFSSDEDALVARLLGDESEMPGLTNKKLVTRKHERDNDLDVALNKNGSIHKCSTEEGKKKISQSTINHQVNARKNAMMQKNADKGTKGDQCVELVRKIRNSKPGDELYQFRANIRLIGDTLEEGWEFIRNLGTPWDTSRRPTHRDMFELFGGPCVFYCIITNFYPKTHDNINIIISYSYTYYKQRKKTKIVKSR